MERRKFLQYLSAFPLSQIPFQLGYPLIKYKTDPKRHLSPTKKMTPVNSGIKSLDKIKGGFLPGEVTLIAGRLGMGKTTVGINIVKNICLDNNGAVFYVSMKKNPSELMKRLLSLVSGVPLSLLRNGDTNSKSFEQILEAAHKLANVDFTISDSSGLTTSHIKKELDTISKKRKQDLIIVDYLQLLNSDDKKETGPDEMQTTIKDLKSIAVEYNVPVLLFAEMRREGIVVQSTQRTEIKYTPVVSIFELVDSGIIIHRESYLDISLDPNIHDIEFWVFKNKLDYTDIARANWQDSIGLIT